VESETNTVNVGDTWQQEKQVRLTAQRVLTEHLRYERYKRGKDQQIADPSHTRFWPGLSIDLTGATLIDFDLEHGELVGARFSGATFSGFARFYNVSFTEQVRFDQATFNDNVGFSGATFGHRAWFDSATFSGDAWFSGATFRLGAQFVGATFQGDAEFGGVNFSRSAEFREVTFGRNVSFDEAAFKGADSFSFERSRILSPDSEFAWPTGWCLDLSDRDQHTVVRAEPDDGG
jgi:uncharacterized protein YjbI with pentapeptide repeats